MQVDLYNDRKMVVGRLVTGTLIHFFKQLSSLSDSLMLLLALYNVFTRAVELTHSLTC